MNTLEAWASAVTEFVRGMSLEEWGFLVAVVTLLITLATLVYKAYARRRDRTPSVKMAAHWNLPRDVPEVFKGLLQPATAKPGEAVFECEITSDGMAGVKIRQVYMYFSAPPGKPIPLHLPEGEHPRRLVDGDSQTWLSGPFDYEVMMAGRRNYTDGGAWDWVQVVARDTVGNTYELKNPNVVPPPLYTG